MKFIPAFLLSLFFIACSGKSAHRNADATAGSTQETAVSLQTVPLRFEPVAVPSMITDPGERAAWAALHYWDRFDFGDTAYIHAPEVTEQAFTDYLDLLNYVTPETARVSLADMLSKAEAEEKMYTYFFELYEKYLYDPNSPVRNEEHFIPVLQTVLRSPLLDETAKIRPAYLLEQALKNRIGEAAADFSYTLADGRRQTLYGTKADWLLLYFYNPDCHMCQETTRELSLGLAVERWRSEKGLKILAVYPDADLAAWQNHLSAMPASWINGYNEGAVVKEQEIYDLKAIPTLYLLNKEKKVVLKDATFAQLEMFLQQADRPEGQ